MSVRDYFISPGPRPVIRPYSGSKGRLLLRFGPIALGFFASLICIPYGFYYALTTPWLLVPFLAPLAILALIVIWVAPEMKTIPIKPMEHLFFGLFVGFVMWPNYLAISLPGLPWITVSRLLGAPLFLIFLVSLSSNRQFRLDLAAILSSVPVVWRCLLVMIVLQVISLPFSYHPGGSISRLVIIQMTITAPFLLACYIFMRPGRAYYAAHAVWLMAIGVSIIGLLEAPMRHTLWAGHIPSFLAVEDEAVARIIAGGVRNTTGQYRVQAVFSTALGLAEYLGLATPFVLHLALSKVSKLIVRIGAAATLPLILLLTLGADSRFGLMVYFLSGMGYLLTWALLQRHRHHSLLGMAVVMSYPALFTVGVAASFVVGRIRAKVWGTGQYNDSTAARVEQLNAAIPESITHPIGHGLGMGAEAVGYVTPGGLLSIDSYLIAITMELGYIGLIAFVTFFLYLSLKSFFAVIRSQDETSELTLLLPAAITMSVFLFIKLVFAQEDNHPFVYVLAGMTVALLRRYALREAGTPLPHDRLVAVRNSRAGGSRTRTA